MSCTLLTADYIFKDGWDMIVLVSVVLNRTIVDRD